MPDTPTSDPNVVIEEQWDGYVRYRRLTDGRRWEVHGFCDMRGDCLIGAVIEGYEGRGIAGSIADHDDIEEAKRVLGVERLGSELDVPSTPECDSCCCKDNFTFVELERGD
jgi:hypothetical protein